MGRSSAQVGIRPIVVGAFVVPIASSLMSGFAKDVVDDPVMDGYHTW